jgi:ankyrin repeat protein
VGKLDCCKALVDAKAKLNLQNNHGATPLDLVDRETYRSTYDYLVSIGAKHKD